MKSGGFRKYLAVLCGACCLMVMGQAKPAKSQDNSSPQMRIAIRGKAVYIYHTMLPLSGQGFNIYRKDQESDSLKKLNKQPILSVAYPAMLKGVLGDHYDVLQEALQAYTPQSLFLKLRSHPVEGRLYSFTFPEVAQALGRLYIDSTASIGSTVTYHIEFVNDIGNPTGKVLDKKVTLKPHMMVSPTDLSAKNKSNLITLKWKYAAFNLQNDDHVIRFNVYQQDNDGNIQLINDPDIILRQTDKQQFQYTFNVDRAGVTTHFFVRAVSITGQESESSEVLDYKVVDNVPPNVIGAVGAAVGQDGILVSWPNSKALDVEGYRVYRKKNMQDSYSLMTKQLLPAENPSYTDTTAVQGNVYYYSVTAVDSTGNESPKSVPGSALYQDVTPPPSPRKITVSYKDSVVNLSWTPSRMPRDFKSWIILRQNGNETSIDGFLKLNLSNTRDTVFIDRGNGGLGFSEGAYYRYGLAAVDSSNNVSDTLFTVYQVPDNTPPQPPSYLRARNHDAAWIDVIWTHSASGDATTYQLSKKRLDADSSQTRLFNPATTNWRDEQIDLGHRYLYSMIAVDSAGNKSRAVSSDTVLVRDHQPPRRVSNVQIRWNGDNFVLTWSAVVTYDMAGYRIYKSSLQTGVYHLVSDSLISQNHYNLGNKAIGNGEWLIVRAVDTSENESRNSEPVEFKAR